MIWGLQETNALARVSYHAQELSLLAANGLIDAEEMRQVKLALDEAFREMFNPLEGKYGAN